MVTEPNTINQHYVWRHSLQPWAEEGTFVCYRHSARNFFEPKPDAVAKERYFYEIFKLTDGDKKFLDLIIGQTKFEEGRRTHRQLVASFQRTFQLREILKGIKLDDPQRQSLERELTRLERNLGERYHTGIENDAQPILAALRQMDDSFIRNDDQCIRFLHFLLVQYFRTAKISSVLNEIGSGIPDHDPMRTHQLACHIFATNVAGSLYVDRANYQVVFLVNSGDIPFIVGDQPVINLLDSTHQDLELFYPLSPKLAIIFAKKNQQKFPKQRRECSRLEVENYNYQIFQKSHDQVYSNNKSYLMKLVSLGKQLFPAK